MAGKGRRGEGGCVLRRPGDLADFHNDTDALLVGGEVLVPGSRMAIDVERLGGTAKHVLRSFVLPTTDHKDVGSEKPWACDNRPNHSFDSGRRLCADREEQQRLLMLFGLRTSPVVSSALQVRSRSGP